VTASFEPAPPIPAAAFPAGPPANGGMVGWALAALAESGDALRAVLHPLGFLCIPLFRGPGLGVCVHMWADGLPTAELITSPIHSHSWDLLSYVLFGRVDNDLIRTVAAAPAEASHRVYQIDSAQGADRIIATSQYVRCARAATHYAAAGDAYTLAGGEFHTTVVAAGSTAATILVARTLPGARDRSLGPPALPGNAASWRIHRRFADATLTRQAVEAVLDRSPALA
jgi:hypothetical protein